MAEEQYLEQQNDEMLTATLRDNGPYSPQQRPRPIEFAWPGALVAVMIAVLLALHEVSDLCAGFVTGAGQHTSPGMLASPWAWGLRERWNDGLPSGSLDDWTGMVVFYEVLDFAFVAVYLFALLAVLGVVILPRWMSTDDRGQARGSDPAVRLTTGRKWLVGGVVALAAADLTESGVHVWLAYRRCPAGGCVEGWQIDLALFLTYAKWLMVIALVIVGVVSLVRRWSAVWKRLRRIFVAMWVQRFSMLAFLPLAVLAVLPLGKLVYDVFDQLPDVQRAWLDGDTVQWDDIISAGVVFGAVVLPGIFFMGRIRADFAARRESGGTWWPYFDSDPTAAGKDDSRQQTLWFWLVGPGVLFVVAVVGVELWLGGTVFWWRLIAFCAVPAVVVLVSGYLRWRKMSAPRELPDRAPPFAQDVMAVGDVLAVAALSLTGLGLVRAFTGPATLGAFGLLETPTPRLVVALLVGFAVAILCWPVAQVALNRIDKMADLKPTAASAVSGTLSESSAENGKSPAGVAPNAAPRLTASETPRDRFVRRTRDMLTSLTRTLDVQMRSLRVLAPGLDIPLDRRGEDPRNAFTIGLLILSTIGFVFLCAEPQMVAEALGALAAATLGLGTLTVMLGVVVSYVQLRQPPEIFQLRSPWRTRARRRGRRQRMGNGPPDDWRLRATPVILLLVLAVILAQVAGSKTDVHPVGGGGAIPERPTMDEAFDAWLLDNGACSVKYEEDSAFTVRPMLMFAAEGGGIRAAYWTASALGRIGNAGSLCGRRSALFSAGASGGAVGLTLGRFDDDPHAAVENMTGPDALGAAALSLFTGDLLAGAAGIRFDANADNRNPDRQPLDRAGLMEVAWERAAGTELNTNYLPDDVGDATSDDGAVSGQLILTTSVAWDGCRALLSQIDLHGNAEYDDEWPLCGDPNGDAGPNSYDLFDAYGRHAADDNEHCLGNVRALTAALLASRFPYVTPSGVVGPCRNLQATQIIDGGYTDNTGLGTIVDLAPMWQQKVRENNDNVLREGSGELVLPMVVYLENGTGDDYSVVGRTGAGVDHDAVRDQVEADNAKADQFAEERRPNFRQLPWPRSWAIPEAAIPEVGWYTAGNHKVKTIAGLIEAEAVVRASLCTPVDAATAKLCEELQNSEQAANAVYVVHQSPQPSMAAPLGWVLSDASEAEMTEDLDAQQANPSAGTKKYGTLNDLLVTMGLPTK